MPNIILKKFIGGILIGIGCLAVGIISYIVYIDFKMLILSSLITCGMFVKSFFTYRRFKDGKYITVTGTCTNIVRNLFARYKTVEIATEDENLELYLPKETKLSLNEKYIFYFSKKPKDTTIIVNQYITSRLNVDNFLGYEKLSEVIKDQNDGEEQ